MVVRLKLDRKREYTPNKYVPISSRYAGPYIFPSQATEFP